MKKTLIFLLIILVVVIIFVSVSIIENSKTIAEIKNFNTEYETYMNKEVFGTSVTSVINKAIDNNEKNSVQKDDKGLYIENNKNSIKVEIQMIDQKDKKTYQMETINKVGITQFVKNFNLIKFKCTKIEYHDETKKVSKVVFEQIEE